MGQAAARLARLRDRAWRARTARSTSARTSTTARRRRAWSCVLPQEVGHARSSARRAAGTKQWWSGAGDDYDATLTRAGRRCPAGSATLTFQARWNIEDCGPTRATTRYVEVDDGTGFKPIAGIDHQGRRGQRHRRLPGHVHAGDVRPVGLRRQDGLAALPLQDRRRRAGHGPERPSGFFADEIKVTAGATTVFTDGAESGDNGWTPVGFTRRRRVAFTTLHDNYYIASNRHVRVLRPVPADRAVQLRLPGQARTGSSTSRTRTACSSPTGTRRTRDNNKSQHPGQGVILPIDANPRPDLQPRRHAVARRGSRPTTRRSGWRRRTRSRCTRRRARRATSAARPRCRCSTTAASTGTRRCRTSA